MKTSDIDGLPYSTVLYGSGPGHGARVTDPTSAEPGSAEMGLDMNRVHAAAAPRQWATHGAEDVPVYAMGEDKFHQIPNFRDKFSISSR